MTETEWLGSDDAVEMLGFLLRSDNQRKWLADEVVEAFWLPLASDRKQRLCSLACCRHIWNQLNDGRSQKAVEVGDRFVEGIASREELAEAHQAAKEACSELLRLGNGWDAATLAAGAAEYASDRGDANVVQVAYRAGRVRDSDIGERGHARRCCLSELVRDIFGNPFRPVCVDPTWLTLTVVRLAEHIYQERAFDQMPILADALEDADCDNADILNHCRQSGEHVRGCWLLDLLLGKE